MTVDLVHVTTRDGVRVMRQWRGERVWEGAQDGL